MSHIIHICHPDPSDDRAFGSGLWLNWVRYINQLSPINHTSSAKNKGRAVFVWAPSSLLYKAHLSRQWNCWSLRCSWSIAYRRCSNYNFILSLTPLFNGSSRDNDKARPKSFQFLDLVRLILRDFTANLLKQLWIIILGVLCYIAIKRCFSTPIPHFHFRDVIC